MLSPHPTTDPGIIVLPKPTKKPTSELTLKSYHLKPKNKQNKHKTTNKRSSSTPNRVPKSTKDQYKSNPRAQSVLFGAPVDPSTTNW